MGSLDLLWQDLKTQACNGIETTKTTAGDPATGSVEVKGILTPRTADCLEARYVCHGLDMGLDMDL